MEVFLLQPHHSKQQGRLLHARGGVSGEIPEALKGFKVFSTHVEVFPNRRRMCTWGLGLLHARGGVSRDMVNMGLNYASSPHTWRCFLMIALQLGTDLVFSTHVEVFLYINRLPANFESLLHARGGVSLQQ